MIQRLLFPKLILYLILTYFKYVTELLKVPCFIPFLLLFLLFSKSRMNRIMSACLCEPCSMPTDVFNIAFFDRPGQSLLWNSCLGSIGIGGYDGLEFLEDGNFHLVSGTHSSELHFHGVTFRTEISPHNISTPHLNLHEQKTEYKSFQKQ